MATPPALYLEPGGDEHLLTYRELAETVRWRSAELAGHRPADGPGGGPLLALEGHRAPALLVETLAALEAGWSVVVANGAWWPRERDALYERLQPTHVLRVEPAATGTPAPAPSGPGRGDRAPGPATGPLLWAGSAGGEGDPRAHAFTVDQVRAWLDDDNGGDDGGDDGWDDGGPGTVLVIGELGHLATLRTVLAALGRGATVRVSDRTHLAAQLAQRRHLEVVTTPVLFRRALRQLHRRGRRPAGAARLVLHQGHVRPHERSVWTDGPGDAVQARVSLTEAGGWLLLDERPAAGVLLTLDVDGSVSCAGDGSSSGDTQGARPAGGWGTGDLAEPGDDGTVRWIGRRRDRFVADGHEIDPVAVEAVVAAHPLVAEVAVAPRPHPERGNLVVAVLVPADPEWPPFLDDLAAVTAALPEAARPSALAIVEDLPLNAAGAVHRRLVNYEEAGR